MAEALLWTRWMHCGTLKADVESTLLVLDAEKFQRIVSPFPTDHCHRYASAFVERLNVSERTKTMTDLILKDSDDIVATAFPELYGDGDDGHCKKPARLSQRFLKTRTKSAVDFK